MAHVSDQTESHTDAFPLLSPMDRAKADSTIDQKKVLGLSAATLLLGGAAWAIARKIENKNNELATAAGEAVAADSPAVELPVDIDVATQATDDMAFGEAFAVARDEVGMGGVFSWRGRWYNTFNREEWGSLSLDQRQEYTELVLGEKLPIRPFHPVSDQVAASPAGPSTSEPTVIEGYLRGERVLGLDFDRDGLIDSVVLDGADGYTYNVVDTAGSAGLDTLYQYDALSGALTASTRLEEPFVLSNDDFSVALENAMAREVIDSILEPEVAASDIPEFSDDDESLTSFGDDVLPGDDTYVNDGDVRDMDE